MSKRLMRATTRAALVLPVLAACDALLANSGIQVPLSQYQAGSEHATLVTNGNFSSRADNDANGTFETATGWNNTNFYTEIGMKVDTTINPPANTAATSPYSAQAYVVDSNTQPQSESSCRYDQPVDKAQFATGKNYVVSAYMWNFGRGPTGSFGENAGDYATMRLQDNQDVTKNVTAILENNGLDGQTSSTGRLVYFMVNEENLRGWSSDLSLQLEGQIAKNAVTPLSGVYAQFDNASITPASDFIVQKWTSTTGGSFTDANNWLSGVVPSGTGAVATLQSASSTQGITVPTGGVTLGMLKLDNPGGYNISGDPITLDTPQDGSNQFQGTQELHVQSGNHTIAALIYDSTVQSGTTQQLSGIMRVEAGASVSVGNLTMDAVNLRKEGAGLATVDKLRTSQSLAVNAGTIRVASNGTTAGTSDLGSVTIAAGAKLDVTNNKTVIHQPTGTWTGTAYSDVTGQVAAGRGDGSWNGSGIVTSVAGAADYTSLGTASAGDVLGISGTTTATWSGRTVGASDTLVMYTYGGDANLDGVVNIDDYTQIDSSASVGGALKGWFNGDFNYDGNVDIDDYTIIDSNITIQGPPLGPSAGVSAAAAVTAVPEPAGLSLLGATVALGVLRRRRNRP